MPVNRLNKYIHLGLGWIGDRGGGLERYQHGICNAHSAMGCNVSAWVQSCTEIDSGVGYPVTCYASPVEKRASKIAKLQKHAGTHFAKTDFTLVSHHASVSASIVGFTKRAPHVVHFHGPWADEAAVEGAPWWKTILQRRVERKAYQSANRIIALSETFKRVVVERYGVSSEVVRVVPGAIDIVAADAKVTRQEARDLMEWPRDRPIVLSVRRLVKRVGMDVLVDAVKILLQEHQQFSDLLVLLGGTGPMRDELQHRINEYGMQENVKLLGFVPDEFLSTAYRAANFSVVPTQSLEGFGLVTLESMATGTPVVVTPVGSLPEIMNGIDPSLVMPGKSAREMAEGLRAYLSGGVKLPDDDTCRDYVRKNYDWSVIAARVLDVYREAADAFYRK